MIASLNFSNEKKNRDKQKPASILPYSDFIFSPKQLRAHITHSSPLPH